MKRQSRRIAVAVGTVCFLLVLALLAVWALSCLPESDALLFVRQGEGEVTLTREKKSTSLGAEERLNAAVGESLVFCAGEELSYWLVNGVRVSVSGVLELKMPNGELRVKAVFGEEKRALDVYTPDAVVFEAAEMGEGAFRPFFPTVTQAEDGTILVVYYLSDAHALYRQNEGKLSGVLQLTRSVDGGKTWSVPETLVDLTDEDVEKGDYNREARDPNLQRLSDGTILLTFPVRAPIGKPGLNGSSENDYWAERSYYMTSTDNGQSWNEMRVIECDYFSRGEDFLYDNPARTTGCWVKNGSVAELSNGELLFPLYGAENCSSRAVYTGVVVKARNNGDGTLTFVKDWAEIDGKTTDAALILPRGEGNETALYAHGDTVYALARTAIPSKTDGGVVYRSADGGRTFEKLALEPTENRCLNQPNFCALGGELVLVNYSVPLASVSDSPARRTARPVYGKLFNAATGAWAEYDAAVVYDTQTATVADMANPSSVLLQDGRIMTVYYDTSAPLVRKGLIGATFTSLTDYLPAGQEALNESLAAYLG